jgi:hypothetical protein
MNTEIFIVSCSKHFPWLDYALQSIGKFAHGFSGVTILVPCGQDEELSNITGKITRTIPFTHRCGQEWPDKGMLWHMAQIMRAEEWCPEADFILHTDSDCIFTEPFGPEDYFVNGKPVLMHASFKWLINSQQANLEMWQHAVAAAVGWKPSDEFMRRHPAVHPRKLYAKARECIESHTKMPCDDYIQSCQNAFPQTFAEFPTLGAVAWRFFRNDYHWIDQQRQPFPIGKLAQFWSHAPPDQPQEPVVRGKPFRCTPADLLDT